MPPRSRKLTTTERGYGWDHQKRVARLNQDLIDETPCWWCGDPMVKGQALHGDHVVALARGGKHAERLLHAQCNLERGDGSHDHLRPALARRNGGHDNNVMDWGD